MPLNKGIWAGADAQKHHKQDTKKHTILTAKAYCSYSIKFFWESRKPLIYKAFPHFSKTAEMLKTIKTIKTIKDAHSPVLKRAVCYNIHRTKEPQEPIKEKRGKGEYTPQ